MVLMAALVKRLENRIEVQIVMIAKSELEQTEFMTYIICTICDYAKANNLQMTDTVKPIGENLIAITKISTVDNWKGE